jgi:hypothetical protein
VIVRFGDGSTLGYRVKGVKRASEETHLALESDPGVAVDKKGARHLFFPLREVSGPVTYRIRTSAFATQVEAPGRGQYKENP